MQKFQVGLIAMLICCVAFVSCHRDPQKRMMAPEKPTEQTMPVGMGPEMIESPTDTEPSKMPVDMGDGDSDVPEGMVLIPAGEFQMGSIDADADGDEKPVHTVSVDAFYMDTHEVTNAEYKAFVDANPQWQKGNIQAANFHDGDYLSDWDGNNYPAGKANHPVTYVSWYAAMAYSAWAEKRLPTEAEWEYAARGGLESQKYPWGDTISPRNANYYPHVGEATAVGQYAANDYGLYDMAGNVWEWCLDEWKFDFYAVSPDRNPLSGEHKLPSIQKQKNFEIVQSVRVLRSGSWNSKAHGVRVANREFYEPMLTSSVFGFRCVRAVAP